MASEQELWVPWSSAADLVRAARQQGTPVTKRLIVDWTARGLMDEPRSRGRGQGPGREKGLWPWNQRKLFLALLRKRPTRKAQFPALYNIPVFLWLWWGDSHVPFRQARRCLLSWNRGLGRTSEKDARRAARQTVRQLADPDANKRARKALEEHLFVWGRERQVNPDELRRLLRPVLDPHNTGQPRGPAGGGISAEIYLEQIESRLLGEIKLAAFKKQDFEQARALYRESRVDYARAWKSLAADKDLGHLFEEPTLDSVANNTCLDLTIILGMIAKGGGKV